MYELSLQRIPFKRDTDGKMRMLKGRTGITPNILCRIGFCISIEEPNLPKLFEDEIIGREINRYTLLGKFDQLFVALLVTNLQQHKADFSQIDEYFIAHMNRGVELVGNRVKTLIDFLNLINKNSI